MLSARKMWTICKLRLAQLTELIWFCFTCSDKTERKVKVSKSPCASCWIYEIIIENFTSEIAFAYLMINQWVYRCSHMLLDSKASSFLLIFNWKKSHRFVSHCRMENWDGSRGVSLAKMSIERIFNRLFSLTQPFSPQKKQTKSIWAWNKSNRIHLTCRRPRDPTGFRSYFRSFFSHNNGWKENLKAGWLGGNHFSLGTSCLKAWLE